MLESLLYPQTVAVIGASRNTEKVGGAIMDLDKKNNQKQQLNYILHMKLTSCREDAR